MLLVLQVLLGGNTRRTADGAKGETETLVDDTGEVRQNLKLGKGVDVVGGVGEGVKLGTESLEEVGLGQEVEHGDAESTGGGLGAGEEEDGALVKHAGNGTLGGGDMGVSQGGNEDGRLLVDLLVGALELVDTVGLDLVTHLEELGDGGHDGLEEDGGHGLEDQDEGGQETGKVVDVSETDEAIPDDEVEVVGAKVVVVVAVESAGDDVGRQGREDAVEGEDLARLAEVIEAGKHLADALVDHGLDALDGTLGEVGVEVTTTGTVKVMVDSGGSGGRDVEGTDGGGVLVGLASSGSVDGGVVGSVLDVNLTGVDTDDGACFFSC